MSLNDLKEALETATTFEEWVHANIDCSIEFCEGCAFADRCEDTKDFKCPYREFYFIPTSKTDLGAKRHTRRKANED